MYCIIYKLSTPPLPHLPLQRKMIRRFVGDWSIVKLLSARCRYSVRVENKL